MNYLITFIAGFIIGSYTWIYILRRSAQAVNLIRDDHISPNAKNAAKSRPKKQEGAFIKPVPKKVRSALLHIKNNDKKGRETPLSEIL